MKVLRSLSESAFRALRGTFVAGCDHNAFILKRIQNMSGGPIEDILNGQVRPVSSGPLLSVPAYGLQGSYLAGRPVTGLFHQLYDAFRSRLDCAFERFGIPGVSSDDG